MPENEQRRPGGGGAAGYSRQENGQDHSGDGGSRQQPRMVKLAELWERTSGKGTRYFSGFMGDAQLLPPAPPPLWDSEEDWTEATLRLAADKAHSGGEP
jgi:hypothetical protein